MAHRGCAWPRFPLASQRPPRDNGIHVKTHFAVPWAQAGRKHTGRLSHHCNGLPHKLLKCSAQEGCGWAHLLHAVQRSDVVQRVQRRRQAAVQAEDLHAGAVLQSANLQGCTRFCQRCVGTQLRRWGLCRQDGPPELSGPHSTRLAAPVPVATGKGGLSNGGVDLSQSPHLVLDKRRERQEVEQVREVLPHVRVAVLPQALVVEAVPARGTSKTCAVLLSLTSVADRTTSWETSRTAGCQPQEGVSWLGLLTTPELGFTLVSMRTHACDVHGHKLALHGAAAQTAEAWRWEGETQRSAEGWGTYTCVICRLSWLPRRMVMRSR